MTADENSVIHITKPVKKSIDLRVMNSRLTDKISIRITDVTGKLLDVFTDLKQGK